jgi:hypothetical protein
MTAIAVPNKQKTSVFGTDFVAENLEKRLPNLASHSRHRSERGVEQPKPQAKRQSEAAGASELPAAFERIATRNCARTLWLWSLNSPRTRTSRARSIPPPHPAVHAGQIAWPGLTVVPLMAFGQAGDEL